jgi:hypothetical protein
VRIRGWSATTQSAEEQFVQGNQFVARAHRLSRRPDRRNLFVGNTMLAAEQARLVPGRKPDEFFRYPLDSAQKAGKVAQVENKVDTVGERGCFGEPAVRVPRKAAHMHPPAKARLFEPCCCFAVAPVERRRCIIFLFVKRCGFHSCPSRAIGAAPDASKTTRLLPLWSLSIIVYICHFDA